MRVVWLTVSYLGYVCSMIIAHVSTIIIWRACIMSIVRSCGMNNVHVCTWSLAHACTKIKIWQSHKIKCGYMKVHAVLLLLELLHHLAPASSGGWQTCPWNPLHPPTLILDFFAPWKSLVPFWNYCTTHLSPASSKHNLLKFISNIKLRGPWRG